MLYVTDTGKRFLEKTPEYWEELWQDKRVDSRGRLTASPTLIHLIARSSILRVIADRGSLPREDVSHALGVDGAVVSIYDQHPVDEVIDWLIRRGFVEET